MDSFCDYLLLDSFWDIFDLKIWESQLIHCELVGFHFICKLIDLSDLLTISSVLLPHLRSIPYLLLNYSTTWLLSWLLSWLIPAFRICMFLSGLLLLCCSFLQTGRVFYLVWKSLHSDFRLYLPGYLFLLPAQRRRNINPHQRNEIQRRLCKRPGRRKRYPGR